jgi:deoxyribodipyrimidine photo-lyase
MKTAIVWFKTDLRIADNETLVKAIERNDQVVPVYCLDPAHFSKVGFGLQKTGSFRAKFLLESLADLHHNLQKLGSGLVLCIGKPEVELPKIAIQYNAEKVYSKKEVAYEELKTQDKVEKALWDNKITLFSSTSTSTLYHAEDLPFTIRDIPEIFTQFRKSVEHECTVRAVIPTPIKIDSPALPNLVLPTLEALQLNNSNQDQRAALQFVGGETEAQKRLQYYLTESKLVKQYKETRNGLLGPDYSTKFSTWLAMGCISARSIYHELKQFENKYGANESTYWVIFELLWRDFFRFMMKKHKVSYFLKNGTRSPKNSPIEVNMEVFAQWTNGKTSDAFVNANMLELKNTGWMSNRGRQNVASFLIHNLKLDWRLGAKYFEQQLIDYDVSSNYGNWAYLAGVGNDPLPSRQFNTKKQAETYDPKGEFITLWTN